MCHRRVAGAARRPERCSWYATVFCKNRDRLLDGDIAAKFFTSVLNLPQVSKLLRIPTKSLLRTEMISPGIPT
jgi:hypothetical protein